ncbi:MULTISPECIES: hypothetical protein [Hafnia]|uniref:hypothetical protein n=1 Tax=Hafnia TaxID=568 RepID=UPI00187D4656|nr:MULTISPECIES: hypothetical protein [Hafnia]MBU2671771.1 hypothetical protein [Hafnia paralvei]UBM42027.1 hypothetical protein K9N75_06120 [Hafnia paralvei]
MRKANRTEPVDALGKIQALAAAAGYLISTERETQLCFELIDLIEGIASKVLEEENA